MTTEGKALVAAHRHLIDVLYSERLSDQAVMLSRADLSARTEDRQTTFKLQVSLYLTG